MTSLADRVARMTSEQMLRAASAVRFVHDTRHTWRGAQPAPCVACPHVWHVHEALTHLDGRPGDAAGARLILHDARCINGAGCSDRAGHARTQAETVAALRKFRVKEAST